MRTIVIKPVLLLIFFRTFPTTVVITTNYNCSNTRTAAAFGFSALEQDLSVLLKCGTKLIAPRPKRRFLIQHVLLQELKKENKLTAGSILVHINQLPLSRTCTFPCHLMGN